MAVRVALVEDMVHVQGVLTDLLATLGAFEVVAALPSEAEARLWLAEHAGGWDLAVVDLVLDTGSGMGVIPVARRTADRNGGQVVVFSDYASAGIQRHCRDLGADAVFSKTHEMHDFMNWCAGLGGTAVA
jgi:DNA-binding NarL/FixJ family response regulator